MRKLLEGVRVLESAVLLNGDMVGSLLGDLGADVIKIESPGRGDYIRDMLGQITPHNSPAHIQVNRHKRSVTLDLTKPEGLEVFWRLHDRADVFVDGYLAGASERLGIGYETQRERRPSIVYCQHTGFGAEGPYGTIPTHGFMQEALASATPMERGPEGYPQPKEVAFSFAPPMSRAGAGVTAGAIQAAYHVAAALVLAQRTGEGCYLDVSAAESVIAMGFPTVTYDLNDHRLTDHAGMPSGNVTETGPEGSVSYQYYETADDAFVLFCAIERKFWNRFCEAIDRPDLAKGADGGAPVDWDSGDLELRHTLMKVFRERTLVAWVALGAEHGVPIAPAYDRPTDLLADPQLAGRQIFHRADHPEAGEFDYVASPVVVSDQPFEVVHHAPSLGEHTSEVLTEIGYSADELRSLADRGVI